MLFYAFAANRQPLFKDQSCFSAGEGIAFNGVACIGELYLEPIVQITGKFRWQGSEVIKLLFFMGKCIVIHTIKYKVWRNTFQVKGFNLLDFMKAMKWQF